MNQESFFRARLYFTGTVTVAIWSMLVWDYFHGGVPSHHLLANKELPSASNGWGGILLPALAWFLSYRIQKRTFQDENFQSPKALRNTLIAFSGSMLYGILLAVFFTFGYDDISGNMGLGLLVLGLFIPIYRSEYILGFILGMTFTFGAILPTIFATIVALVGAVLFLYVRTGMLYAISKLVGTQGKH
jgi:hypothetical protein